MALVVGRGLPLVVRVARDSDRAALLLAVAVRGLPPERAHWGRAMLAELCQIQGGRVRWRFSLGCARTAIVLRMRATVTGERGGDGLRTVMLGGVVTVLALGAYAPCRYPVLRDGARVWAAGAFLVALQAGCALCALGLLRGTTRAAVSARRRGLAGGLVVAAAWLAVIAPPALLKAWVAAPLAVALLVPALVARLTARDGAEARAGVGAALWSGVVGALLVFIVWMIETYARDGRPFDPQLLRDFHRSGGHDLAAYAVSGSLGTALGLLAIVPALALALGSLAGVGRRAPEPPPTAGRVGAA